MIAQWNLQVTYNYKRTQFQGSQQGIVDDACPLIWRDDIRILQRDNGRWTSFSPWGCLTMLVLKDDARYAAVKQDSESSTQVFQGRIQADHQGVR
jgi:hypothetical protein